MCIGGTKEGELQRSAELYMQISQEKGPLLALYFLYDSQHGLEDIRRMLEIIRERGLDQ